jgi:carbon monoxide dehydrogenase subunit G
VITLTRQFSVCAPAGAVLEYLRDFGTTTAWDPATQRTTRIDAGPIVPGARWRNESKILGVTAELTYTLEAADGDRLVFIGRSEGATSTAVLTVRAVDGATEVTYHVELEVHGLAKLATPVLRLEIEKLGDETTGRLTAILNRLVHQAFN